MMYNKIEMNSARSVVKKINLLIFSLLTISFLTNCSINKYQVVFDSNGGTPVPTQEVEENKCAIKPVAPTREPGDMVIYTFGEWQLNGKTYDFNTPLTESITLKASWVADIKYHTVTFDSDGGTEIFPQTDIIYGDKAVEPEKPAKNSTEVCTFVFEGWHKLKNDGTMEEDEFDFINTPITEDITLKAKWKRLPRFYTVTFDSDGGSDIPPQTDIPYLSRAHKPEEDPTKKSDRFFSYTFNGWHKLKNDGTIEEDEFDFTNTPITEDITIKAKWNETRLKYTVKSTSTEHLHFTYLGKSLDEGVEVDAGAKFEFEMEAVNDPSNSVEYKIPSVLKINAGGREFIGKGYDITPEDNTSSTKAKVTIYEKFIIDDITIEGDAIQDNFYHIDLKLFFLTSDLHDYDVPYEKLTIQLSKGEGIKWPEVDDFAIKIDGQEPFQPLDGAPIVYDETEHQIIIDPEKAVIKSNVTIIGRSPSCLLENMSWDEIAYVSDVGAASLLFDVGETKNVKLIEDGEEQSFSHQVRIIDFNHNVDGADQKIGITFEFADLLTNKDKGLIKKKWCSNDYNRCYVNGPIQKYLDGDFYTSVIPDDLAKCLQSVKVYTPKRKADDEDDNYFFTTYQSYFFPLAASECHNFDKHFPKCEKNSEYVFPYKYYLDHISDNSIRLKKPVGGSFTHYATRSQACDTTAYSAEPNIVTYITSEGKTTFDSKHHVTHEFPMAPLFCI